VTRGRRRAPWAAWLATVATVLGVLVLPATPAVAADEPTLALTEVGPAALTPESTLTVGTAVVAGDRGVPPGSRLELRLQRSLLSTRSAVAAWPEQDLGDPVGSLLESTELAAGLAPGESVPLTLMIAPGGTGLADRPSVWGPRGLSVVLRGPDASRLAVVRSHVVWYPADADQQGVAEVGEPLGVTVVVPLTGATPDPLTGVPDPTALAAQVSPGGRLDAVLAAAAREGAVLALDPAVLELGPTGSTGAGTDGTGDTPAATTSPPTTPTGGTDPPGTDAPGGTGTEPPGSGTSSTGAAGTDAPGGTGGALATLAAQWRQRVDAVAEQGEALLLGYGDPDVAALAHAGEGGLAALADERARELANQVLEADIRTDVGWPVGGDADLATLDLLAELGSTSVLLDQSAQPTDDEPAATPDGRGQVTTSGGTMRSLLSDSMLGTALAAVDDEGAATAAVQRLLAETAVIALERPSTSRHVLVTAPRDWAPTAGAAVAAVDALTATPWTRPRALQGLVDADPPDLGRAEPTMSEAERGAELDVIGLERAGEAVQEADGIAAAFADPTQVTAPVRLAALALASAGWRGRDQEWTAQVQALQERVEAVRDSVHVVQGSTLTQVSRNVRLPVTVQNDSAQQVTVRLDVVPRSSRLVVTDTVDLTIAAGSSAIGYVPVRGVGNGDTSVLVRLRSPSGSELGDPVQTRVQVRADWESWGTAAAGGVAALLLLVGLVRTWRRGPVHRGRDPLRQAASS